MSDFRFTNSKVLHEGKWLRMLQYEYEKAGDSKQLSWELVERTTRAGTADAADIIAIVKKDHEPDQIVIVKQYRPPIKGWILEFPAGLIDAGETAEATALRELKEETGYIGACEGLADSPTFTDPGLTNSNLQTVHVKIDGNLEENSDVKPCAEDAEIKTILLPLDHLKEKLDSLIAGNDLQVDSRLYHFAVGLFYAQKYQ